MPHDYHIISFLARQAVVDVHYHQCFQVVISLHAPFDSTIDGIDHSNLQGFVVNQHIPHSCRAQETEVLVYFIDAESYAGWQLKGMLAGRPFVPIDSFFSAQELHAISDESLVRLSDILLEKILPAQTVQRPIDTRIVEAFNLIEKRLDDPVTLDDIGKQLFLSTERFRHLFASETGMPFSQYILWKRIKQVMIRVLQDDQSMATAAVQNGFTDQSHFTRLFKRTFGVSAKQLLRNSRFVQFLTPYVEVALPS